MDEMEFDRGWHRGDVYRGAIYSSVDSGGGVLLAGFGIALVGGFTSRAAMLKIKPFDNSYKKAQESYKVKDDDEDQSK